MMGVKKGQTVHFVLVTEAGVSHSKVMPRKLHSSQPGARENRDHRGTGRLAVDEPTHAEGRARPPGLVFAG